MKYGELNLGQVEAIVNKLGGMEGVHRFLSGGLVLKTVESLLRSRKTIKLGTGLKTADDFRRALKDGGFHIDDWANDILDKPAFTAEFKETEVDLVVISVAELGFKNGAMRKDIYKRAREFGLELCPVEVGPQLRLQYVDQPKDEFLFIAMKPIIDSDSRVSTFNVWRDAFGSWLDGNYGDSLNFRNPDDYLVFVHPHK